MGRAKIILGATAGVAVGGAMTTVEIIVLYIQKVGTILSDRRFYAAATPVVLSLLAVAGVSSDNLDRIKGFVGEDGAALAAFFAAFIPALVALISSIFLNNSWTKRAPSGLGYKKLVDQSAEVEATKEAFAYVVNTFYGNQNK